MRGRPHHKTGTYVLIGERTRYNGTEADVHDFGMLNTAPFKATSIVMLTHKLFGFRFAPIPRKVRAVAPIN